MSPKEEKKLFYRAEEVCRQAKIDPATLALWEEEFPFIEPAATGSGRKIYRQKDIEIICRIKELLGREQLTLAGTRRRLEEEMDLRPVPAVHPDKIVKLLWHVRDELHDLSKTLEPASKKSRKSPA